MDTCLDRILPNSAVSFQDQTPKEVLSPSVLPLFNMFLEQSPLVASLTVVPHLLRVCLFLKTTKSPGVMIE